MTPSTLQHVGVVGGGRMGGGIAHAFLSTGAHVTLVERDEAAADATRASIARSAERSADSSEEQREVMQRLTTAVDIGATEGSELVIEAVPEDASLKARVLGRMRAACPDAVLATNTSSLSLAQMSAGLDAGDRFLGLHFFNPVPRSELVEIVRAPATADPVVDAARGWVEALGKTPIVVSDTPGFASSRLGVAIALEAMRMVEDGVATAADVDRAMELGYRHPSGPLRTTDLVGLDVRLAIAEHLHRELGERFAPPRILREKVAAGELGRKAGHGFYTWP